jgi:CRP-like cAMP-binding protein/SAM-dependent methyltransferase
MFLDAWSMEERAALLHHCRVQHVAEGETLVEQGQVPQALYVLLKGGARVDRITRDTALTVATLEPGEIFGEIAFLQGDAATANVIAETDLEVLAVDTGALHALLRDTPAFAARFFQHLAVVLSGRLRDTTAALPALLIEEIPQIVPIHGERTGVGAGELPPAFVAAVDRFKDAMFEINGALGRPAPPDDAAQRVAAACDALNEALREVAHGRADGGRAPGTYLLRETFPYLMLSRLFDRCYSKPRGYAGDYYTIHMLYEEKPEGDGRLGPLIDRWALSTKISEANRDRLTYVGELVGELLAQWTQDAPMPVTRLASGSARELTRLFEDGRTPNFFATCLDIDPEAAEFASARVQAQGVSARFRFAVDNVVRLALGGGKVKLGPQQLIYSLGLTDYLQDKLVVRLLDWMHDVLLPGGVCLIGNHDPGNPERALLEHVLDWSIIYRSADGLRALFAASKFGDAPVDVRMGGSGVQLFARCTKPE